MKHLKRFNESNEDSDVVIIGSPWRPIIAWSNDVKDGELLDHANRNYYTGTAFIGSEDMEDKGVTDYSSPFYSGQVIGGNDLPDAEIDEMDFTYPRDMNNNYIKKQLNKIIERDYNPGWKIIKLILH